MACILHVEDDPDLRSITALVLEAAPMADRWTLRQVSSVREARKEMASWRGPVLLLADQRLPDGDGVDLAREARQRHPAVRNVILTAYSGLARPEHVDEVVEKPWGLDAMEELMHGITHRWLSQMPVLRNPHQP